MRFFKKSLLLLSILPFLAVGSAKAVVIPLTQDEVSAVQSSRLKYGNNFRETFDRVHTYIQLSVSGLEGAIRPGWEPDFLVSRMHTSLATYILPFLPSTFDGIFSRTPNLPGVYSTDRAILNCLTQYLYQSNPHNRVNWTKGTKRALRKIFVVDGLINKFRLKSALRKMMSLDANEVLGNSVTATEYRRLLGQVRDPQRDVLGREIYYR